MPVPFEAIIPLGIIIGMFGVTGTLINLSRRYQHDWKSNPTAPPSFSTNSVWYLKQLVQTFYPEHQTHELLLSHSLQQQVSESNEIAYIPSDHQQQADESPSFSSPS
ncbi:661_t:CDS:2 [Entrophospora sp. SA101]|nr:14145_t:CDS:2 [Entrophospora sp. SA101]CAJ0825931.1 661_t:CDS:2 [Entrophospora sp. SA101]